MAMPVGVHERSRHSTCAIVQSFVVAASCLQPAHARHDAPCLHHALQAFPYFYVPYDDDLPKQLPEGGWGATCVHSALICLVLLACGCGLPLARCHPLTPAWRTAEGTHYGSGSHLAAAQPYAPTHTRCHTAMAHCRRFAKALEAAVQRAGAWGGAGGDAAPKKQVTRLASVGFWL